MQLRLTNLVLALLGTVALFTTSCKKDFSPDEPLPEEFMPAVYIGSQNTLLYALDPKTGDKKWEYQVGSNIQAAPLVMGDYLFVAAEDGNVHKLDARRGTLVRKIFLGGQLLSTPYGELKGKDGNDYFYIGTGIEKTLIAYDITADTIEWTFTAPDLIYSSPVLYDTLVIFGCYDGVVYGLDRRTGSQCWSYTTGGPVYSSPTVAGGYAYVGSNDGEMYCLRLTNGSMRWSYPTHGSILSSPISYGGNIIFGSDDRNLYCVDSTTGVARWIVKTKDRIVSSPYAFNQVIYAGSYDNSMYAINILDGSIRWQFETGAIIKSSPMVKDSMLYFGSHDKFLYKLDSDNGDMIWRQNINGLIESSPVFDNLDGKPVYTSSVSGNSPN